MVAFIGVPVEGCTLASHAGTSRALAMTHRYLACPSIATSSDATIPRLAPAPTTLPAHSHPAFSLNTAENGALSAIYTHTHHGAEGEGHEAVERGDDED
ncbi:Os04g0543650 [Oryza sativa Japonica Group]|uniref:Os04g0543650 protein n=1 Tax=Oryza sativa subsp. japonica TaxID=39947 RepID=A0A0P0WD26_ORYSJ|nr:hypothetical protein EE612_024699 [Oryza sativa]BAS90317.1 Os04g0543650 [Oryza sativa Japonica Group]